MQWDITDTVISIHALLAESDLFDEDDPDNLWSISIHALLAESDWQAAKALDRLRISIHALLAESDLDHGIALVPHQHFYPRSPCGERHTAPHPWCRVQDFYPRSPCGERQAEAAVLVAPKPFLSTLSLRRATGASYDGADIALISIHALLAESDATNSSTIRAIKNFYPRSPCGERPGKSTTLTRIAWISIHALLAESDKLTMIFGKKGSDFYPRSPCGERQRLPAGHPRVNFHFYPRSPCGERL